MLSNYIYLSIICIIINYLSNYQIFYQFVYLFIYLFVRNDPDFSLNQYI